MAAEIDIPRTPPRASHRRLRTNEDLDQEDASTPTSSVLSTSVPGRPVFRSGEYTGSWMSSPVAATVGSPRKSWEETFQSLSRNLQTICGSNGSIDDTASTSPVNGRVNSPVMIAAAVIWNGHDHQRVQQCQHHHRNGTSDVGENGTPRQLHTPNGCRVESPPVMYRKCTSGGAVGMATRNSFPFSPTLGDGRLPPLDETSSTSSPPVAAGVSPMRLRPGWRTVRVLHEETTDRLRQSLSKICLQNSGSGSVTPSTSMSDGLNEQQVPGDHGDSSSVAVQAASKSRQVRMKESLKLGVRVRLDLVQVSCDPDYVVVSVVDRVLTVWNAASGVVATTSTDGGGDSQDGSDDAAATADRQTLTRVVLPTQTKVNSLACFVTDASVLYVRERTAEMMHVEVEPVDAEIFLPIFREDEVRLTVAMTLHVADDYVIENSIVIRTIDDRLVVKGRRPRRHSGQETGSCVLDEGPSKSFTLMLALPEGTYSRTVRAAFAPNERQLIVTALRAPASRRMTCAF